MKVGIIGSGLMGTQIAYRLLESGHKLYVYNRTKRNARTLLKKGVIWSESPREIGNECHFLIICLTDAVAIKEVCLMKDGLIYSTNGSLIVASLSTISPAESVEIGELLRKNGIEFFQMPVMGGPNLARSGDLVAILSGNKGCINRMMHLIQHFTKTIFYVGEADGLANYMKLALNLNIALIGIAVSESIVYIRSAGLDPNLFIEILNSTHFKTSLSEIKGPRMVKNNFEPRFHLRNMHKDLRLFVESVRLLDISLPFSNLSEQLYLAARNRGYSELDYTAILAFLEEINTPTKAR